MLELNKINICLVGKFMYDVYHCRVPDIVMVCLHLAQCSLAYCLHGILEISPCALDLLTGRDTTHVKCSKINHIDMMCFINLYVRDNTKATFTVLFFP